MWMAELPAFVPFFIGALIALVTKGKVRQAILLLTPVLSGLHLLTVPAGTLLSFNFLSFQLEVFEVDKLSLLFGYIFHIAAFICMLFALHVKDTLQQVSGLLYAGSAVGAVFAGDLLTLFVFWELLAVTSVFLIWARRTERAYLAGLRYLIIQVLSGVILLVGIIFYAHQHQSIDFEFIGLNDTASWLIFIAFGIKCAFPMLHNWVTDAYPEATPTGTVFLSAFTTKVAVYALARAYPGTELLVYIGVTMACFPIFFAVIASLLIIFTILAIKFPETPRVGILRIETTRGDRLFITLLGSAFINLAWLGLVGANQPYALIVCLIYAAAVFRWV